MTFEVDITVPTDFTDVNPHALQQSVLQALQVEAVTAAVLSITLVDNTTIHTINREHLQHDYPTDVISFQLDWFHPDRLSPGNAASGRSEGAHIEGEIVVGAEYAQAEAARQGWEVQFELTLYAIHGMLHICGYDDLDSVEKKIMQAREAAVLSRLGLPVIPRRSPASFDELPRECPE